MSRKIRQIFLNFFILFLALGFSIIIAEVLVRSFSDGPGEDDWVGASKKYYEYDSLFGWRNIPDTEMTRVSIRGQNSVFYRVNSKGIRGPEYPYKKADNEYRILFLGDSFTEGYMVEEDDHFAGVMKRKLNDLKNNKHFEALNSGVAGWSTDQELLFFQNEGKKFRPDLTILMFFQNDLFYNNELKDWGMYYKPLFKVNNGELVLTNVPVPKPDKIAGYSQLSSEETSIFKRIRKWLHVNSHLYGFIKERITNTYILRKIA
ncbi:MAG: SGNH/GDSL hydrolase family protein, partial [Thermodesulfovibrionia bacterium]|nr:SGNH/GDSL hydrolase family protein [Thermodesulfovibrionia bacterium]